MRKKLEIELFRYENLLFGKVLHMDESLRGANEDYDNRIFEYTYSSEREAIEVAQDIRNGINFINEGTANKVSSSVYRVI